MLQTGNYLSPKLKKQQLKIAFCFIYVIDVGNSPVIISEHDIPSVWGENWRNYIETP